ncbi:MAG: hypothetical protein K8R46_12335 [Pirellulales bacterium]|nr:hypothetical protein [Pirellulales bacterium]
MNIAVLLVALSTPAIAQDGGVIETQIGDAKERITFHNNGQKKVQVLLKKDKDDNWVPDGVVRTWYPSGNRRAVQRFQMGVRHGKWESYYDNAKQYSSIEYKEGEVVGEARHWYDSGTLQSVDNFSTRKNGDLLVSHIAYHSNGNISEKGDYIRKPGTRSSLRTGQWKHFDEEGQLTREELYVDGNVSDSKKKSD